MQLGKEPFPHAVIDNAFDPDLIEVAARQWPALDWVGWGVHYDNALEKGKRACNDWRRIPPACQLLLNELAVYRVQHLFKSLPPWLVPDCGLWGGGMHSMATGSHLDLHEDSDVHPHTHWHRRLNAILFLNKEWHEEWGGHLEFWNKDLTQPVVKILPAQGRLAIFAIDDQTYHGVPTPLTCPPEVQRMSLAMFWFSCPIEGMAFKRPRANFVGPAGEHDESKEILRSQRRLFPGRLDGM